MTFKSFLLGSAAALLTVGGAEAADVSFPVAEPVNYVKVCDAFGTGYFYQPGTDTCIKIGGYVRFDVNIGDNVGSAYQTSWQTTNGSAGEYTGVTSYLAGGSIVGSFMSGGSVAYVTSGAFLTSTTFFYDAYELGNSDDHEFVTEALLNVSARTQTELGLLVSYLAFVVNTAGEKESANGGVDLDEGYLSLGPLLAGYTGSTFDPGGGYGIYGLTRSDVTSDQIRLSFAFGGFGIMVAAEDYQDRVNSGASIPFEYKSLSTGELPDLIAAVTAAWGGVDAKVAFGYGQRTDAFENSYGTWGISARAEVNLDALSVGSRLKLVFGYAQDGGEWVGVKSSTEGEYLQALAAVNLAVSPTVWIDAAGSWVDGPRFTQIKATGGVTYKPVPGFSAGAAVEWTSTDTDYKDQDDVLVGKIRLQRNF